MHLQWRYFILQTVIPQNKSAGQVVTNSVSVLMHSKLHEIEWFTQDCLHDKDSAIDIFYYQGVHSQFAKKRFEIKINLQALFDSNSICLIKAAS